MASIGASSALAQSSADANKKVESEWISYRDAYKTMIAFEKYGKAKHLIQNRFQIISKDKAFNIENLKLTLNTKNSVTNLSLDALGQTQLPLLKAAYDENAELSLSPKLGQFSYRSRISIQIRADSSYELSELRQACEQVLGYLQYIDTPNLANKKCVAVKFGFDKRENNAGLELRMSNQAGSTLPISENASLWPDSIQSLKVGQINFAGQAEKAHVVTKTPPLIIIAVIE